MGLACPHQLSTELLLQVLTQMWHLHGLQRERGINIAGWEALLEFRAGKWQDPPPSRGSTLLSAAAAASRGFLVILSLAGPRDFTHQGPDTHGGESCTSQRPCHLAFLMCLTDKPSTPATKTSL